MATAPEVEQTGFYTANLLGNIRSHIAGLQGYGVMAMELIQNADDAKSERISFEICRDGLRVRNSGTFSYCGQLQTKPCPFGHEQDGFTAERCDFHRISDVGSAGKLNSGDNIGRFGIGFVSTYQVTDHPEISSAGVSLILYPERGSWVLKQGTTVEGTSFFLPWADDPNTEGRRALGVSHISEAHIDQVAEEVQAVVRRSLLFLRNVRHADVFRDGKLLLSCTLEREGDSTLKVRFAPGGAEETWTVLRCDAADAARALETKYSQLASLKRRTEVTIAIRLAPTPLEDGLLYAFLPTEQSCGLPLHVNADFFPQADRKDVIFAGNQHEQSWNEMLVDAAATELAKSPAALLNVLGQSQFWGVLSRAYDLSTRLGMHPSCFKLFWERLKGTLPSAEVVLGEDGQLRRPDALVLALAAVDSAQAKALARVGVILVSEELRPFHSVVRQLGAPILTLDRLAACFESNPLGVKPGSSKTTEEELAATYRPLWRLANDLITDSGPQTSAALSRLRQTPFAITEDLYVVTFQQSVKAPPGVDSARAGRLLPGFAIVSSKLREFPKLHQKIDELNLSEVVAYLQEEPLETSIKQNPENLRDLYDFLAELDRVAESGASVYRDCARLPIWLSGRGFVSADHAMFPGDFTDPTGLADLLVPAVFTDLARHFLSGKLDVRTQSIEAFVENVLPGFFTDAGPRDAAKYPQLILEVSAHPSLLNDDKLRRLLGDLPLVPTQNGGWATPRSAYRRSDDLVRVLGEATHLWIDGSRMPSQISVHSFLDSLGIRRQPAPIHLVERMLSISSSYEADEAAQKASSEAFYALCEQFDEQKDKSTYQSAIGRLRNSACFPIDGDSHSWHSPTRLYAPYQAEAFRSQAQILAFRNTVRLKPDLLEKLGMTLTPETALVVGHLKHCIEANVPPSNSTYQFLNVRNRDPELAELAGIPCIYVESMNAFLRPNQVYWQPQQLGRFAHTIPSSLEQYKPFFTAVGVKDSPAAADLVDVVMEIIEAHFDSGGVVEGVERQIYETCFSHLAELEVRDEVAEADLRRLRESPCILNLIGQPTHPDEVVLQDSEWHAGFFNHQLDRMLCQPPLELSSLVRRLGVARLSESARVMLEAASGETRQEPTFVDGLAERSAILERLLHDKPARIRTSVRDALHALQAESYDVVQIVAVATIDSQPIYAPPASAQAFFDVEHSRLILARPVGAHSWPHVLSALLHQLMPEETGAEISKLTLGMRPLVALSPEEAHEWLTAAGVPYLHEHGYDLVDVTSGSLDELGVGEPEDYEVQPDPSDVPIPPLAPEPAPEPSNQAMGRAGSPEDSPLGAPAQLGASGGGLSHGDPAPTSRAKKRAKHKERWDRRLLSYVHQIESKDGHGADSAPSEHNLHVEAMARAAVEKYELERGRVAEQMAQMQPGYDIISVDTTTGEQRFIEVKGVMGEWGVTGVGLSHLQFTHAQRYGDAYWLYVVEFAGEPDQTRVHAIQSPANQVTSFMFDGNWRAAATDEKADPILAFVPGARILHSDLGEGVIELVEVKGVTRLFTVLFDANGRKKISANLRTIRLWESEDGDHLSGAN